LVEDSQKGGVNWETLYGLFENAIYGGRIDGIFDIKVNKYNNKKKIRLLKI